MKIGDWALIGTFLICLLLGSIALHKSHEYQHTSECLRVKNTSENQSTADDSKNTPPVAAIADEKRPIKAQQKGDCDADQGDGQWWGYTTNDMLVIIGFLQFIGLLGGIAVYLKQANVMSLQLQAISRQGDIAERSLVAAEQAFVFAEGTHGTPIMPFFGAPVLYWEFVPRWKNCGTTPARGVLVHTSVQVGSISEDFDYPDRLNEGEVMETNPITIGPGVSVLGVPRAVSIHDLERAIAKQVAVFMYGWIEYDDIFPGTPRHRTEFCVEIIPRGNPKVATENQFMFANKGPHNGSEDECYRSRPRTFVRRSHNVPPPEATP